MKKNQISRCICAVSVLTAITACGGGSTNSMSGTPGSQPGGGTIAEGTGSALVPAPGNASGNEIATGVDEASQGQIDLPVPGAALAALSGRVADGYLVGATVCVDINENNACDESEPSAITGDGGVYELEVAADQALKPIVADVPSDAIDEDTNEPIGKKLLLSAPPGRPEFVSPITRLVHQELGSNPAQDVETAEANVKQELGLGEDDDTSLFDDYVADAGGADETRAQRSRYLHKTAQVLARMMQTIQSDVEDSVRASGLDIDGDQQSAHALQRLLRQEVRALLPQITRAVVASIEEEIDSETTQNAAVDSEAGSGPFNPDSIASGLLPGEIGIDLERIEAERDRPELALVTVEDMLREGFYWFDVECDVDSDGYAENYEDDREYDHLDDDYPVSATDTNRVQTVSQSIESFIASHCYAGYGHITLAESGDRIEEQNFQFDFQSGEWINETGVDEEHDDQPALRLVDGRWTSSTSADDEQ